MVLLLIKLQQIRLKQLSRMIRLDVLVDVHTVPVHILLLPQILDDKLDVLTLRPKLKASLNSTLLGHFAVIIFPLFLLFHSLFGGAGDPRFKGSSEILVRFL